MLLPLGFLSSFAPLDGVSAPPPPPPPVVSTLLLDTIAGVVVGAYGLRRLRRAYAGPAVRVRRSSDNAEQDIGFTGDGLDIVTLLAFCGLADGQVSKFYDQTGAGQDVGQAVASLQPQIVSAGALVTLSNASARPAMLWSADQYTQLLNSNFVINAGVYAAASVAQASTAAYGGMRLLSFANAGQADYEGGGVAAIFGLMNGTAGLMGYQGGPLSRGPLLASTPFQVVSVFDGAAHTLTMDGVSAAQVPTAGLLSEGALSLGRAAGYPDAPWDGAQAEHLIISGPVSAADLATIRASQRTYYGTP